MDPSPEWDPGCVALNTLKYKVCLLAGKLKVHKRMIFGSGLRGDLPRRQSWSPWEYRPLAKGKTDAWCERTRGWINTCKGGIRLTALMFSSARSSSSRGSEGIAWHLCLPGLQVYFRICKKVRNHRCRTVP